VSGGFGARKEGKLGFRSNGGGGKESPGMI